MLSTLRSVEISGREDRSCSSPQGIVVLEEKHYITALRKLSSLTPTSHLSKNCFDTHFVLLSRAHQSLATSTATPGTSSHHL